MPFRLVWQLMHFPETLTREQLRQLYDFYCSLLERGPYVRLADDLQVLCQHELTRRWYEAAYPEQDHPVAALADRLAMA